MHTDSFIVGLTRRPHVMGWELRKAITTLVASLQPLVTPKGITIKVDWEPIPTAAVNHRGQMLLCAVKDDAKVSRAMLLRYVGFVIHEVLHLVYTDFSVRGKGAYLDRLHNAVEDVWIERRGIANRVTGNISAVLSELVDQIVGESMTAVQDWTKAEQYPFVLAIHARRYGARVPVAEGLEPIFDEASRRIDTAQSSADTLAIAQWVHDQLKTLPTRRPQSKPQKGEQGEGEQGQQGQQGQQGEGQTEGQGEGQAEGQQKQPSPGKANRPAQDCQPAEVEPSLPSPGEDMVGGPVYSDGNAEDGAHVWRDERRSVSINVPARLRYEVRRMFDNTGLTLFNSGRKSGSLCVRELHRTDGRVFQKRTDIDGIDSAVSIVLDVSGSMMHRLDDATSVCYALADALINAEVQVELITFGCTASRAIRFGGNRAKVRSTLNRVGTGGGTNDLAAVRMALDDILPLPVSRKVVFVITDGQGWKDQVRELCEGAARMGITVIGVGIACNVSGTYPQSVRVNDLRQLGAVVFNQIKLAA